MPGFLRGSAESPPRLSLFHGKGGQPVKRQRDDMIYAGCIVRTAVLESIRTVAYGSPRMHRRACRWRACPCSRRRTARLMRENWTWLRVARSVVCKRTGSDSTHTWPMYLRPICWTQDLAAGRPGDRTRNGVRRLDGPEERLDDSVVVADGSISHVHRDQQAIFFQRRLIVGWAVQATALGMMDLAPACPAYGACHATYAGHAGA